MNTQAGVCPGVCEKQQTSMFGRAVTSGHERKDSGEQGGRSKLVELGCRQKLALMVRRETALSGKKLPPSLGVETGGHDVNMPSTEVKGKAGI